jgi:hypothetical protein
MPKGIDVAGLYRVDVAHPNSRHPMVELTDADGLDAWLDVDIARQLAVR